MSGHHLCPKCRKHRKYSYRFDAFFCEEGNVWLDHSCLDRECIFCSERPPRPDMSRPVRISHG